MNYAEAKIAGHGNVGKRYEKMHGRLAPGLDTWCGRKATRVAVATGFEALKAVTCKSCLRAIEPTIREFPQLVGGA